MSRWKYLIKIRAELNDMETKKTTLKINETNSGFFGKKNGINKPLAKLTTCNNEN